MADNWIIKKTIDLSGPHILGKTTPEYSIMYPGDNLAHTLKVNILDNGIPAITIAGTISAYFQRKDGETVLVTGSLSNGVASVTLAQECYAIPGFMRCVVRLTNSSTEAVVTLAEFTFTVQPPIDSGEIIDPGEAIGTIDELLAQIEAMEEATAAANAAAAAVPDMVAPTFSTSVAYTAGQYVYYDGGLYRFTTDHAAGYWNSSHVVAVTVGGEVAELKSAIENITTIGTQLFDKDHAEVVHLLPANGTVSAAANVTSVIIPVNPSASDTYITVHRDTISSRFTVATFTGKPDVGSTPVNLQGANSAYSITVPCSTSIKYIMVLVLNTNYDTSITVETMLNGLMVQFGQSYTGYESYQFGVIIPDKSVGGDSFSDDGVAFISGLVDDMTESEKALTDANRKDVVTKSDVALSWTEGSYYDLTTGELTTLSDRAYTGKADCSPGDRISITNSKGQILFWKANGVFIGYNSTSYNSTITFVAPDGAVKYAFNNTDSTVRGSTATKYVDTNPLIESECTAPAKLIYGSESFISGKYCSTSDGKISTVANFYCLPFIPVKSNHKYRTQTQTQVVFYDSSLGFISALLPGNDANNTGTTVEMDFTTPATCKYISVNSKSAHEMLFDLDYTVAGYIDNPQKLQGKTVVCFGDSITGNYAFGDNYPYEIEKYTGAKTYNCGFGGCRMELVPSDSDVAFTNPFSMCGIVDALEADKNGDADAWDDMDENALTLSRMVYFRLQILKAIDWSKVDIVTIAYGTNEGGYPQDDEQNKYNKQTYAGATRYCIEKLLTLYPKLRIVLLTPIYRYYTSENQDSDTYVNPNYGNKLTDNVATLISVGHEYKIPVIDLYYTLGINIENYTSYFGDEDEQSDGTHINSFGREQFGRRVAGELMRLM